MTARDAHDLASEISATDTVSPADREAILSDLVTFNVAQTGAARPRPLSVLVRGRNGAAHGGLIGRTGYGWLAIELFFLPEDLRGGGLGRRILGIAEAEAVQRGCHSARVETASFQALGFYQKAGYSVFGTLDRYPDQHESYVLRKALARLGRAP